jgi:hypothetical protein
MSKFCDLLTPMMYNRRSVSSTNIHKSSRYNELPCYYFYLCQSLTIKCFVIKDRTTINMNPKRSRLSCNKSNTVNEYEICYAANITFAPIIKLIFFNNYEVLSCWYEPLDLLMVIRLASLNVNCMSAILM